MKLALLITLFSATYSWGLEYSEIIGDYKCDLTEVPHGLKNEASNSMELKNLFGEVIFRFKKDGKLDLLNLINKDQVEGTYDISAIDLAGDDLTLSCKSILADVRSVNYLVQITKFSKHYLFKINNISLLFVRDDDSEMQKEKSKIKQLDDSGYLRDGKSMVWWGTGPCGLENDKGSHEGVLVGCLYDHSPAAISGLQLGDEIIQMNGIKTTDWNVIREFIKRDATPAKDFELKIIRNDKELVFKSFMITLDINSQERMSESGMCKNLKEK